MAQLLVTPHAIYKWMRKLVIGYDSAGSEVDPPYIDAAIEGAITSIAYFKLGVGAATAGGVSGSLTRTFFDANCKDLNSGKGDVAIPHRLYATDGEGYATKYDKALLAENFYNYGASDMSKVIGALSVNIDAAETAWWAVPGVLFQVGCHLTQAEGNYEARAAYGDPDPSALGVGDSVLINEVGLFDEDDVMVAYGTFANQSKNDQVSLRCNNVVMLKLLDYQLSL